MSKGLVLSLCDYSGNMVRSWAEAGWPCICVDIQSKEFRQERFESGGWINYWNNDIMDFSLPEGWKIHIMFAFPPCTHLAVSGARHFKSKGLSKLIEGLTLVERCRVLCEESGAPYMIENPVSTLSTYWRKPDHIFSPHEYGGYLDPIDDQYTKKTCLWTGGGFIMPEPKPVEPIHGSKMHRLPPSEDRANLRSETPKGFAKAVYECNRNTKRN